MSEAMPLPNFGHDEGRLSPPWFVSFVSISILSSWVCSLRQVLKIIISIPMS
jgi:hypothetical protein